MPDLCVTYMGLSLANPLIAGSSTQTGSAEKVKALAEAGAGAVVLNSIFEEQIRADAREMEDVLSTQESPEAYEYVRAGLPEQVGTEKYLELIRQSKAAVRIPVIASLNCTTHDHWISYARKVQLAGADALELNVYDIPHDALETAGEVEQRHLRLVEAVCGELSIPVAVKLGPFYTALANFVRRLTALDVQAIVLFNRFFQPEIDVEHLRLRSRMNFSSPQDVGLPVRWIGLLRNQVDCDIAMTTGVHDAEGALKGLLAGANAVQLASALYKQKPAVIGEILQGITEWMGHHGFVSIEDFRGRMSEPTDGPKRGFARAQYVKTLLRME